MDPVSDTRASIWIFIATVRDQEVEGSNPFAPTTISLSLNHLRICSTSLLD